MGEDTPPDLENHEEGEDEEEEPEKELSEILRSLDVEPSPEPAVGQEFGAAVADTLASSLGPVLSNRGRPPDVLPTESLAAAAAAVLPSPVLPVLIHTNTSLSAPRVLASGERTTCPPPDDELQQKRKKDKEPAAGGKRRKEEIVPDWARWNKMQLLFGGSHISYDVSLERVVFAPRPPLLAEPQDKEHKAFEFVEAQMALGECASGVCVMYQSLRERDSGPQRQRPMPMESVCYQPRSLLYSFWDYSKSKGAGYEELLHPELRELCDNKAGTHVLAGGQPAPAPSTSAPNFDTASVASHPRPRGRGQALPINSSNQWYLLLFYAVVGKLLGRKYPWIPARDPACRSWKGLVCEEVHCALQSGPTGEEDRAERRAAAAAPLPEATAQQLAKLLKLVLGVSSVQAGDVQALCSYVLANAVLVRSVLSQVVVGVVLNPLLAAIPRSHSHNVALVHDRDGVAFLCSTQRFRSGTPLCLPLLNDDIYQPHGQGLPAELSRHVIGSQAEADLTQTMESFFGAKSPPVLLRELPELRRLLGTAESIKPRSLRDRDCVQLCYRVAAYVVSESALRCARMAFAQQLIMQAECVVPESSPRSGSDAPERAQPQPPRSTTPLHARRERGKWWQDLSALADGLVTMELHFVYLEAMLLLLHRLGARRFLKNVARCTVAQHGRAPPSGTLARTGEKASSSREEAAAASVLYVVWAQRLASSCASYLHLFYEAAPHSCYTNKTPRQPPLYTHGLALSTRLHCAILVLLRALHESVPAGAPRGDVDLIRCTLEPWTQALPSLHTLVTQSLDEVINCETDLLSAAHIRNDRIEVCVNNLESIYNNVLRE